jgi:hypothetical protein
MPMSFDQWYRYETGINTDDLTDEEYEMVWADEEILAAYQAYLLLSLL